MRNAILFTFLLMILGCQQDAYYGYVHDFERKTPIAGVIIDDFLNEQKTLTDSNGYFRLEHTNRISGKLILSKVGYVTDTLETVGFHSGEQEYERFKGDTIFLFDVNNHFRDSLSQVNRFQPADPQPSTNALPFNQTDLQSASFKEIGEQIIGLDDYYCSRTYPKYLEFPMLGRFQVKILKNECGDFPFYGLITTFRGTLVDKKMISVQNLIDAENENQVTTVDFDISKDYTIRLRETKVTDGMTNTTNNIWRINAETGKIEAL